jgi:hypothetical protein
MHLCHRLVHKAAAGLDRQSGGRLRDFLDGASHLEVPEVSAALSNYVDLPQLFIDFRRGMSSTYQLIASIVIRLKSKFFFFHSITSAAAASN